LWVTKMYSSSVTMFSGCVALVGGSGTAYDASHVNVAYARIDGGTSAPGYFTDIDATVTTITLNAKGYATYSNYYPVEVSGAKVYTASLDLANGKITCSEIEDAKVPAGEGVLLFGEANAEVTLTPVSYIATLTGNDLKATTLADGTLAQKGSDDCYSLSGDTFMKFTGENFVPNKAYFGVESGSQVRGFSIVFDDATGISTVAAAEQPAAVYDLQGRRVEKPAKGIYVVNGKKMVKK